VESGVAEVFLCFFKHAADAFLLRDVVVQLVDVSFGLFGALMLELRACAFSFFRVSCRSFYFAHVTVVAEVHDDDDRNTDQKRPESCSTETAYYESCTAGAGEITDRDPEEVASPHVPDRLVALECGRSRADDCMDEVLDHAHHAKRDDGE